MSKAAPCSFLGIISNLLISREKNDMARVFQEEYDKTFPGILNSAATTLSLANGISQSHEDGQSETIIGDAWFGNLSTLRSVCGTPGPGNSTRHCILNIKGGYKCFPKKAISEMLIDKPSGCSVVFRAQDPITGVSMLAIGWKMNEKKVFTYLATEGVAKTTPSKKPYHIRYNDKFGNRCTRDCQRPTIIDVYYSIAKTIDIHNHLRQGTLKLEEKWITSNGVNRVHTTLIAINVTDTLITADNHNLLGPLKTAGINKQICSISTFAGVLAQQLLSLSRKYRTASSLTLSQTVPKSQVRIKKEESASTGKKKKLNKKQRDIINLCDSDCLDNSDDSSVIVVNSLKKDANEVVGYSEDRVGNLHTMCKLVEKFQKTTGKKYRSPETCSLCEVNETIVFCKECKKCFCYPLKRLDEDDDLALRQATSCFQRHVDESKRTTGRKRKISNRTCV